MRRKETKQVLEIILRENYYEQQFRMLDAAMDKMLQVNDLSKTIGSC